MLSGTVEFPVIRFVDYVLGLAVQHQASDVHFESFSDQLLVRLRIDGSLLELPAPDPNLATPIISRLKTLANLDPAEKRLPQDGHIEYVCFGRPIDFRISTLPTQYGESIVLRVLDRSVQHLNLGVSGIDPSILAQLRQALRAGSGIILTTGPTGSGKTTTLYSALAEINDEATKIITVEDPVEYEMEGIVQVNVREEVGLTFESAMRAFLRHDPDKILIGELRDTVTAKIAIQAALTGHLVLGTLHTNDAPSAITRLMDMGIEDYLLADTLRGILAQRLVRRICLECREEAEPTLEERAQMESLGIERLYRGMGCEYCQGKGYRGRFGIYEWMPMSFELRDAVRRKVALEELEALSIKQGRVPLKEVVAQRVNEGLTTLSELNKI